MRHSGRLLQDFQAPGPRGFLTIQKPGKLSRFSFTCERSLQGPSKCCQKGGGGRLKTSHSRSVQGAASGWGVGASSPRQDPWLPPLLHAELGLPVRGITLGSTEDCHCSPHTEGARVPGWAGLF